MTKTTDMLPGTLDMLILKAVSLRPLHGYGVLLRIQQISGDAFEIPQGSLYPALYRLEERGWIKGAWVEKPGERRRRFYKVTAEGRRVLAQQRKTWAKFVEAVRRITGEENA